MKSKVSLTSRLGLFTFIVCLISTVVGIMAERYAQQHQAPIKANAAVQLLANHAGDQWLQEDKLILQTLVRAARSQEGIAYTAILDAANTPVVESGDDTNVGPEQLYFATIKVANSEAGYAVIGFEQQSNHNAWYAISIALLIALLTMLVTAIRSRSETVSNETELTRYNAEIIAIVGFKKPMSLEEQRYIEQINSEICDYYDANIDSGPGYLCFYFHGHNTVGRGLAVARLWYGCYYAMQRKQKESPNAAMRLAVNNTDTSMAQSDKNDWLFNIINEARLNEGVSMTKEFAELPATADFAHVSERNSSFYLKKLNADEEIVLKKQLSQLVKLLPDTFTSK